MIRGTLQLDRALGTQRVARFDGRREHDEHVKRLAAGLGRASGLPLAEPIGSGPSRQGGPQRATEAQQSSIALERPGQAVALFENEGVSWSTS